MAEFSPLRRLLLGTLPGAPLLISAQLGGAGSGEPDGQGAAVGGFAGSLHAKDFGAVGDGSTDDTAALAALLAAMKKQGKAGVLGGQGAKTTYLVRTGELVWQGTSTSENEAGPTIFTTGRVILKVKGGSANAPILYLHNEPAKGGRFLFGGYIGPLEFIDSTGDRAPGRHALQLYGVMGMRFATLFSEKLQGDLVHIERKGTPLTGDAWNVAGCIFEGLVTWNTQGWTLNNDSLSQFFNGNEIGFIWNINGARGAWRGPGAANYCRLVATQGNAGWAVDWTSANAGDSVQGSVIEYSELDGPEYGIRVNGVQSFRIGARFVHRLQELPRQSADRLAWPKVALQIGGREGLATRQGKISIFHYFRTSITERTRTAVGTLVDLQDDPTTQELEITHALSFTTPLADMPGGFKLDPSKFVIRHNAHARSIRISFDGHSFIRNSFSNALVARIEDGRLPDRYDHASRLNFGSVFLDEGNNYSRQDREYTVRATGKYHIAAQIMIDARPGEQVKLGIMVDGTIDREMFAYAAGGVESFRVEAQNYVLEKGQRISIAGAAEARPAFVGGTAGILANNRLEITET